ncbi:MAG: crossover junction endodeoxyribonuclease RuvC [Chloroflexi bacterium]|nr:crossover junction endodeoxyribonuclease RuvC [Chloroflexota bacterium]
MIVLGIDPGTAALGYGVVERTGGRLRAVDDGCISTSPSDPLPERLLQIHTAVRDLIATHRPALLAVERLFFSRNAQTAFAVGQARGVVLLAAAEADVAVREATPSEVKSAVAGHGGADKEQVARMVAIILGLDAPPRPDDAADALAIAIWAANRERAGEMLQSAVLDRAAVAPLAGGSTPYERAVREALGAERIAAASRSGRNGGR